MEIGFSNCTYVGEMMDMHEKGLLLPCNIIVFFRVNYMNFSKIRRDYKSSLIILKIIKITNFTNYFVF